MGVIDQKQFTDAVSRAKGAGSLGFFGDGRYSLSDDWVAALNALNRLAMFDMLPALDAITFDDRRWLIWVEQNKHVIGDASLRRIASAKQIVENREIEDNGLPEALVNDGRQFLGCTRLDDFGVQQVIDDALSQAKVRVQNGERSFEPCCGVFAIAWLSVLVRKRRAPGASLISNLAAAAHYMLARYHVCAAKATPWQMKIVIDGYDEKKRGAISRGDRDLKSVAITGNRPFPPDFAIRNWAKKGATDGEADRLRCNSRASQPVAFPDIDGSEL
jgi:hypothetical protein